MPCINCHGLDGKGIREGGILPSDITWKNLTKPYSITLQNNRKRGPYSEKSFIRAITQGQDSAHNDLSSGMPRFNIRTEDAQDLIAYLKIINQRDDRGIQGDKILIGSYFPAKLQKGHIEHDLSTLVEHFFAQYFKDNAIYNKHIRLVELSPKNLATKLQDVFAIIGSGAALQYYKQEKLINNNRVPFISLLEFPSYRQEPYIFRLLPNLLIQAKTLIDARSRDASVTKRRLFIVKGENPSYTDLAAQVKVFAKNYSWRKIDIVNISHAYGNQVREASLIYLASGIEIAQHIKRIKPNSKTQILIPAPLLQQQLQIADFGKLKSHTFIAMPMAPVRRQSAPMQNFISFIEKNKLDKKNMASKMTAFVASKFLVDSLVGTGQHITQDKFMAKLNNTKEYVSGLLPPMRYSEDRRQGINGALILAIPGDMSFHELD